MLANIHLKYHNLHVYMYIPLWYYFVKRRKKIKHRFYFIPTFTQFSVWAVICIVQEFDIDLHCDLLRSNNLWVQAGVAIRLHWHDYFFYTWEKYELHKKNWMTKKADEITPEGNNLDMFYVCHCAKRMWLDCHLLARGVRSSIILSPVVAIPVT